MSDYHRRTAVTRLQVGPERRRRLEATIDEWRRAATVAATVGWEVDETAKTKLQSLAYETVREQTALGSQHAILAIHEAAQALASAREVERTQSTSKPTFTAPTVQYDVRSMTVPDRRSQRSSSTATASRGTRISYSSTSNPSFS